MSHTNIQLTRPVTPFINVCVCVCACVCVGVRHVAASSLFSLIFTDVSLQNCFDFARDNWEHVSNWMKDAANTERGVILTIGLREKGNSWRHTYWRSGEAGRCLDTGMRRLW